MMLLHLLFFFSDDFQCESLHLSSDKRKTCIYFYSIFHSTKEISNFTSAAAILIYTPFHLPEEFLLCRSAPGPKYAFFHHFQFLSTESLVQVQEPSVHPTGNLCATLVTGEQSANIGAEGRNNRRVFFLSSPLEPPIRKWIFFFNATKWKQRIIDNK